MIPRPLTLLALGAALACAPLAITGCGRGDAEVERSLGFEEFVPLYNSYIQSWLENQQAASIEAEQSLIAEIAALPEDDGENRERLETQLASLRLDLEKYEFRLSLGDYLTFLSPEDVPDDLTWEDGMDQPEIGDPAAIKGGVYRTFIPTFPPTIRPFGENSNNGFRGYLYDMIDLPLVNLHPETMAMIPGLASEWAVTEDGRTVFFRIDPEARYSDGVPVRARDFLVNIYLRASDNVLNPYSKQYFREQFGQFAVYDERTLSISISEANVLAVASAGAALPAPPHFYDEYGPDYTTRYQWSFPPTTGAYEVLPEDLVKGASVTQTRVKDWWARDRRYYQHRFNADKIVHTVIRDDSKAMELFRAGQLDTMLLTRPDLWYEKSEIPPVFDGYIERDTFYNLYPKLPWGLYLNVTRPLLDDRNVRVGIQHAMNWRKVIDSIYRGDYQRLNAFNEGFVYSDPSIRARSYSISEARAAFREAGFTEQGPDGILRRQDGTRLSVSVTYGAQPIREQMFAILREDARACGLELRLDSLEPTVSYRKIMQKQHDMTFTAWMVSLPLPDFHQFLHSTNAFDAAGNVRPQTNNIFSWARPDTDRLSELVRTARTNEEMSHAVGSLQRIMHDEAIFSPAFSVDFTRIGSWRWVRWPDSEHTRFSPPMVFDPHETFVYWIDEEVRTETLAAMREGRTFPEVERSHEQFRNTSAAEFLASFQAAETPEDEASEPESGETPEDEPLDPEAAADPQPEDEEEVERSEIDPS